MLQSPTDTHLFPPFSSFNHAVVSLIAVAEETATPSPDDLVPRLSWAETQKLAAPSNREAHPPSWGGVEKAAGVRAGPSGAPAQLRYSRGRQRYSASIRDLLKPRQSTHQLRVLPLDSKRYWRRS
ncbi:hypothetical protein FDECE_351 [Fusarium decemcellulare]|nr:hypothetical protein FDECE_351 [Fusarium decemcellulare]